MNPLPLLLSLSLISFTGFARPLEYTPSLSFSQNLGGSQTPLIVPISPLEEIRVCESGRTALRAGAKIIDFPFELTAEGSASSATGFFSSGPVYETVDGWRCEIHHTIHDGRPSLEIRIYAPVDTP